MKKRFISVLSLITGFMLVGALAFTFVRCDMDGDNEGKTGYKLTVNVSPTNGGTVSRNPNTASYDEGTSVEVTATAHSGFTFTGWSGAATGTDNPVTVVMDSDKTLTATFTASGGGGYDESYTLQYVLTDIATVKYGKSNSEFSTFISGGEKTYKLWADWLGITFDQFIIEIKAAISAEEGYTVTGIKQTNGAAITETTPLWIVGYYVYVTYTN